MAVFGVASDEDVPEEGLWLVHFVEQLACVGHVAQEGEGGEELGDEAVLDGEAGGEEESVGSPEANWVRRTGLKESGEEMLPLPDRKRVVWRDWWKRTLHGWPDRKSVV